MDWQCACTFFNSSHNAECLLCSASRPKRQLETIYDDQSTKKFKVEHPGSNNLLVNNAKTAANVANVFNAALVEIEDPIKRQIQEQTDRNHLKDFDLLDSIIFSSPIGKKDDLFIPVLKPATKFELQNFDTPQTAKPRAEIPLALSSDLPTSPTPAKSEMATENQPLIASSSNSILLTSNEHLQAMDEIRAEKIVNSITTDEELDKTLNQILENLKTNNGGNGTPPALNISLMPHQLKGLAWMMKMERDPDYRGGILADDMVMIVLILGAWKNSSNNGFNPSKSITTWRTWL